MIHLFCHHRHSEVAVKDTVPFEGMEDGEQGRFKASEPGLSGGWYHISFLTALPCLGPASLKTAGFSLSQRKNMTLPDSRHFQERKAGFCMRNLNYFNAFLISVFHSFFPVACMYSRHYCKGPSFQDIICEIILTCCPLSSPLRAYPPQVSSSPTSHIIWD